MNKKYLGLDIKKGTFVCRSTKIGDFTIGKWVVEELNMFLRGFRLPMAIARSFYPFGTITKALWQMRRFSLPPNKPLEVEDVIMDILNEDTCKNRRDKWEQLAELEMAMKQHDQNFKGFYAELSYWDRLDRCISNFDSLISSIPDEIKNRGAPQYSKDYISIDVDD